MKDFRTEYEITLRPGKGALSPSKTTITAHSIQVNHRGDLLVMSTPTRVLACFASGSWISATSVKTVHPTASQSRIERGACVHTGYFPVGEDVDWCGNCGGILRAGQEWDLPFKEERCIERGELGELGE